MTAHLAPTASPPPAAPDRLRIGAWVLYDLANTVYAATVTFLFTPYAKEVFGGDLRWHSATTFVSMVLAACLVPFLGALVDQTARTGRYLAIATLACIGAIAAFGLPGGTAALLIAYFVANVTYNLGLLFYNSLLPAVAPAGSEGRVSGLGTGLGYLGTILVLLTLRPLHDRPSLVFPTAAAMFLVFALPCLLLVRDPRPARSADLRAAAGAAMRQLQQTLRELPRHRPLLWFLAANFCLVDVLNTAVNYFAAFTLGMFPGTGTHTLLGVAFTGDEFLAVTGLLLNGLALVFGIVQGPWADRAPLGVMGASAVALLGALVGGAWFGGSEPLGYVLTLVVCGAFGLAGIWTAGRKVVVLLAPPERAGGYFGLYGITVKVSVVGSLVYGFVDHHAGTRAAMLAQSTQLLLGLFCLAMVRLPRHGAASSAR